MVSFANSFRNSSSSQAAAGPSSPLRREPSGSDRSAPAKCPVDHKAMGIPALQQPADHPYAPAGPAKCPVQHGQLSQDLNPLNNIPSSVSPVTRAPGQKIDLPTERTASTIPRPLAGEGEDTEKVWDYPSPQQFYNALVRKGWETPEESVEMMVFIHNFLNERAWQEVLQWEKKFPG
jgi:cytochrome c heme-lyase